MTSTPDPRGFFFLCPYCVPMLYYNMPITYNHNHGASAFLQLQLVYAVNCLSIAVRLELPRCWGARIGFTWWYTYMLYILSCRHGHGGVRQRHQGGDRKPIDKWIMEMTQMTLARSALPVIVKWDQNIMANKCRLHREGQLTKYHGKGLCPMEGIRNGNNGYACRYGNRLTGHQWDIIYCQSGHKQHALWSRPLVLDCLFLWPQASLFPLVSFPPLINLIPILV